MSVKIMSPSNLELPARVYAESLSPKVKEKFLHYVTLMEEGNLSPGPLVDGGGPGRFLVKISNEENVLVEFRLFLDSEPQTKFTPGGNPRLLFYPIDVESWKVHSSEIWVGRPGEQTFRCPDEVNQVLRDLEKNGLSKFAVRRSDGVFEIFIPERNIRGTAVWRT